MSLTLARAWRAAMTRYVRAARLIAVHWPVGATVH